MVVVAVMASLVVMVFMVIVETELALVAVMTKVVDRK